MSQVLSSICLDPNLGKDATIYSGTKPIVPMPSQVAAFGWTDHFYHQPYDTGGTKEKQLTHT